LWIGTEAGLTRYDDVWVSAPNGILRFRVGNTAGTDAVHAWAFPVG